MAWKIMKLLTLLLDEVSWSFTYANSLKSTFCFCPKFKHTRSSIFLTDQKISCGCKTFDINDGSKEFLGEHESLVTSTSAINANLMIEAKRNLDVSFQQNAKSESAEG
jgi:hypothetical protein